MTLHRREKRLVLRAGGWEVVRGVARHMPLLSAAKRILLQLDGVNRVEDPMNTLASTYQDAGEVYIEQIDGNDQ